MQTQKLEFSIKVPIVDAEKSAELVKNIRLFARAEVLRLLLLEKWDRMLSKSRFTEEDAVRLGRQAKKGRFLMLKKIGAIN